MSILFWKRTYSENVETTETTDQHPWPVGLFFRSDDNEETEEATRTNPLPVEVIAPPALAISNTSGPGDIVTGAAYADLDAMGVVPFAFFVPTRGMIQSAYYFDRDDEGLQVDLWLFSQRPVNQTDNGAFVVSDDNLLYCIDVVQFIGFRDANTGQVSPQNNLGIVYDLGAGGSTIYALLQARGALNIAQGSLPQFQLRILPL